MKRKPKTQFRIVAVALLVVAATLLFTTVSVVPSYHAIFDQPWQKSFVSEVDFKFYKTAFREVCFILFPLIALIPNLGCMDLLTYAKKIPEASS